MQAAATSAAIRKLFGTDGVRGVAGDFLTAELALQLARAAAARVHSPGKPARALIIRDTRESGEMLEAAVAAGIAAAGGEALLGGILPTPGAPLLIKRHGFDLGVVISASHNPYRDNGIKFFGGDGYKLSDATEAEIEAALEQPPAVPEHPGRVREFHGALEDYLRALHERFAGLDLSGRRVLLDCANGATFRAAPEIFRRLGADVGVLAHEPDGRNINLDCGSTHTRRLQIAMQASEEDIGFAFDGDGDRVLAVDRNGVLVDGDELIALAALHLRHAGRLPGGGVAVTVMTNYGFHTAMREHGVEVATTPVGDRYVLEELRRRDWALGGEQSGHIIDRNFVPSGDGIAAALLTLEALGTGDLADRAAMEKLPQKLVNVRVADRRALEGAGAVHAAVARESSALAGRGRVLLRPSGTEPVVRVMVEAPTVEEAETVTARLVALVESQLG
ncbi:phosphoglucosamine mutase [Candidatus Solirubrobacter pratensis]|uniref:phosphoglucosamine mutase n=1 Tax=Candidatus Solirubrobacter pratensis TaxID=1298857 RepID=UPI000403BCDF|nr:phosphoglucosamine mutase [Candidatus Solirubrobacter pratensis]